MFQKHANHSLFKKEQWFNPTKKDARRKEWCSSVQEDPEEPFCCSRRNTKKHRKKHKVYNHEPLATNNQPLYNHEPLTTNCSQLYNNEQQLYNNEQQWFFLLNKNHQKNRSEPLCVFACPKLQKTAVLFWDSWGERAVLVLSFLGILRVKEDGVFQNKKNSRAVFQRTTPLLE